MGGKTALLNCYVFSPERRQIEKAKLGKGRGTSIWYRTRIKGEKEKHSVSSKVIVAFFRSTNQRIQPGRTQGPESVWRLPACVEKQFIKHKNIFESSWRADYKSERYGRITGNTVWTFTFQTKETYVQNTYVHKQHHRHADKFNSLQTIYHNI